MCRLIPGKASIRKHFDRTACHRSVRRMKNFQIWQVRQKQVYHSIVDTRKTGEIQLCQIGEVSILNEVANAITNA